MQTKKKQKAHKLESKPRSTCMVFLDDLLLLLFRQISKIPLRPQRKCIIYVDHIWIMFVLHPPSPPRPEVHIHYLVPPSDFCHATRPCVIISNSVNKTKKTNLRLTSDLLRIGDSHMHSTVSTWQAILPSHTRVCRVTLLLSDGTLFFCCWRLRWLQQCCTLRVSDRQINKPG